MFLYVVHFNKKGGIMERNGITILTVQQFLNYLALIKRSEFVFKLYPEKDLVYFEVLLSENAKLVAKMKSSGHKQIGSCGVICEPGLELFTDRAIVGDITIREIMRDGIPGQNTVKKGCECFIQSLLSKYDKDDPLYPVGLACGLIFSQKYKFRKLQVKLEDWCGNMSGLYYVGENSKQLFIGRK